MTRHLAEVEWRFVDFVPEQLEEGVIYIAPEFGAVMHRCLEGCGERISTRLIPAQWTLTFDGETISLWPSVGSWDLPCRSHYIIRKNRVIWSDRLTDDAIAASAERDRLAAAHRFSAGSLDRDQIAPARRGRFDRLIERLARRRNRR